MTELIYYFLIAMMFLLLGVELFILGYGVWHCLIKGGK